MILILKRNMSDTISAKWSINYNWYVEMYSIFSYLKIPLLCITLNCILIFFIGHLYDIVSVIDKPDAHLTIKPNTSKEKGDV